MEGFALFQPHYAPAEAPFPAMGPKNGKKKKGALDKKEKIKPTEKKKNNDQLHKTKITPTDKKKANDLKKKGAEEVKKKKAVEKTAKARVPKPNIVTKITNPSTGEKESTYVDMGETIYKKVGKKKVPLGTERDVLTCAHSKKYSGKAICKMVKPQMFVVHITDGIGDYNVVRNLFRTVRPNDGRPELSQGNVNVGAQYVMQHSSSGRPEIYKMVPDDRYIMRAATGYNTYAINLEITSRQGEVSNAQIDQAVELIAALSKKYKGMKYLVGHGEALKDGPHSSLVPAAYRNRIRSASSRADDPGTMADGRDVMIEIRKRLKERYGIVLQK